MESIQSDSEERNKELKIRKYKTQIFNLDLQEHKIAGEIALKIIEKKKVESEVWVRVELIIKSLFMPFHRKLYWIDLMIFMRTRSRYKERIKELKTQLRKIVREKTEIKLAILELEKTTV